MITEGTYIPAIKPAYTGQKVRDLTDPAWITFDAECARIVGIIENLPLAGTARLTDADYIFIGAHYSEGRYDDPATLGTEDMPHALYADLIMSKLSAMCRDRDNTIAAIDAALTAKSIECARYKTAIAARAVGVGAHYRQRNNAGR